MRYEIGVSVSKTDMDTYCTWYLGTSITEAAYDKKVSGRWFTSR